MKFEEIVKEKHKAMKNKDILTNKVLTLVIARVKNEAIEKKCLDNIPETMVNTVLLKETKEAKENYKECPTSRKDLKAELKKRYEILSSFAPKLIKDEQKILNIIKEFSTAKDLAPKKENRGMIMKGLIAAGYKEKIDMATVNIVLTKWLQ